MPSCTMMMDWAWRIVYRLGFRAARFWWWLRRPRHEGVLVAIWLKGRVLIVQQSYRSCPCWPGGGVRPGEDPRDAASRELAEEIGLAVHPSDLVRVMEVTGYWEFRRDHLCIFTLHIEVEPQIRIDNREIIGAEFVYPKALLARADIPPFMREQLTEPLSRPSARPDALISGVE